MDRQIVWNKRAVRAFNEIVEYLEQNASELTAEKFVKKLYEQIEKVNRYPEIGRITKKKTIRQYKIDKYRKLYYRKQGRKLIIVFIFDDRRNPKSNPYKNPN